MNTDLTAQAKGRIARDLGLDKMLARLEAADVAKATAKAVAEARDRHAQLLVETAEDEAAIREDFESKIARLREPLLVAEKELAEAEAVHAEAAARLAAATKAEADHIPPPFAE